MEVRLNEYFAESIRPNLQIIISLNDKVTVFHVLDETNTALLIIIFFIFPNVLNPNPLSVHNSSNFSVCYRFQVVQVLISQNKVSVFSLFVFPVDLHHLSLIDDFFVIYDNILNVFRPQLEVCLIRIEEAFYELVHYCSSQNFFLLPLF